MQSKAFYAVATGDQGSLSAMLENDWPIASLKDTAGKTVMHVAAQKNNPAAITAMIKAGVPVDPITTWKETPLHLAVRNGNLGCVKELLGAGASKSAVTYGGDSPLALAQKYRMSTIEAELSK